MPVWQEIIPFHCSATLSEQGTLADSSTFQFSDYNACVNVLEPGQPVYLYPLYNYTVTTWGRNLYSLSITVLFVLPFLPHT